LHWAGGSRRLAGLLYLRAEVSGSGEDFSDDGVDVFFGGAVIDDAGAEGEVAVDCSVGEVDATAADDAIEDATVEVVEIVSG